MLQDYNYMITLWSETAIKEPTPIILLPHIVYTFKMHNRMYNGPERAEDVWNRAAPPF